MKLKYIIGVILLLVMIVAWMFIIPTYYRNTSSIIAKFKFIENPTLNHDFKMVLKLSSKIGNHNAHAEIRLSENIELISGNLNSIVSLMKGKVTEIPLTLKITKIGEYKISGFIDGIHVENDEGKKIYRPGCGADKIYLDVSENDVNVSHRAPKNNWRSSSSTFVSTTEKKTNADIEFGFTQLPELNKEVNLLLKVISGEEIRDARINIGLHRLGLKLVKVLYVTRPTKKSEYTNYSGVTFFSDINSIYWRGDLKKDEEFIIHLIVKTVTTGSGSIYCTVSTHNYSKRKSERIGISVGKYVTTITNDLIEE
jgi:uncharacterized protein involved in tolerance to divalent cations